MQEQVPSSITPDQGWSQMKVILDREMPVNRRSRRMVFLWRSFMTAGILTAFSFLIWDNANTMQPVEPQPSPATPKQEQPAAPAPAEEKASPEQTVNFADATQDSDVQREAEVNDVVKVERKSKRDAEMHSTQTNAYHGKQVAAANAKSIAANQRANATAENNSSSIHTTTQPDANPMIEPVVAEALHTGNTEQQSVGNDEMNQDITTSTANIPSASTQTLAVRNGQVTQGIPGLALDLLAVDSREHDIHSIGSSTPAIVPAKRKKDGLDAYVNTGVMAGYHNSAAWQAGAGLSIKALPKLRVSAGGSYRTFSPDFRSGEKDPAESLDGYGSIIVQDETYLGSGVSNYVNDFSLNASTDYQAVEPLVKTIRQWQIDAGLSYDVTKRWFIQAGASYALQTTAISAVPILADAINFNPAKARFGRSLEDYNIIREHMVSVSGGIGYHIGRNLDIYAQVDHSINPYLETEPVTLGSGDGSSVERTDYIRGLTFGIKYRWL